MKKIIVKESLDELNCFDYPIIACLHSLELPFLKISCYFVREKLFYIFFLNKFTKNSTILSWTYWILVDLSEV